MKKYKVPIPKGMKVKRELWPTTNSDQVILEFEPIKKLPKTWEEYRGANQIPQWLEDWASIPEKHKALGKLEILRDHYNDGWKPDWENCSNKYCIFNRAGTIMDITEGVICHVLAFNTEKLRDEFLENFAQLIEEAKSLL